MGIFKFLDRKKQIPGHLCAPNSKSLVHPTNSNGQDVCGVKRAKVKEFFGVTTMRESWEVDELLNKACWQDPSFLTDDGDESTDSDSVRKDKEEQERTTKVHTNSRSDSDLPLSSFHAELPAQTLTYAPLPPSTKPSKERGSRKPDMPAKVNFVDVPAKGNSGQGPVETYRKDTARPAKLEVLKKAVSNSRDGPGTISERTMAPHPIRIGRKKNASCVESFPLPPPFYEKHYLPTPQSRPPGEVFSVGHPLPQPPPTIRTVNVCVPGHLDEKGYMTLTRAVSCEVPSKSLHPNVKEHDVIVKAVWGDPSRQLTQKLKAESSAGSYPAPPQCPQNMPPTTPLKQLLRTPQTTPPTTPRTQPQQSPQNTPPTTPRMQTHQAPQKTPPTTPRPLVHPQVFINVSGKKTQSPPSSNRHSPRLTLTTQTQPQPQPHLPSQRTQVAYSPPCSPLPKSLCPRKWTKGVILGQGTFGTVHEGLNLEDGSFFAVKVSSREDTSPEIQQEVDVLSKLEHPNIVRYLGSSIVDNRLCIFLELVRMGSLDSILQKYKRFQDNTIRSYTRQILLGLEYLHAKRTIHRDVKCGNILVDVNGQVKLSDFGIAKQVGESLASSVKGTPLYMAPEVLVPNKESYSYPADIWSLGCTVLEMADGKPPWSNLQGFAFFFKVKSGELPPMPAHLSPEARDFICSCLKFSPRDRPTASELLEHPFVLNVATPEPLLAMSPPSPVSPKLWPPGSPLSSNTWACGNCYPTSPNEATCFDQVLAGSQRARTLVHGR